MSAITKQLELGQFVTPEESEKELVNMAQSLAQEALVVSTEEFQELTEESIKDAYKLGAHDNRASVIKKVHQELAMALFNKIDTELKERYEKDYTKVIDDLKKENHEFKTKGASFLTNKVLVFIALFGGVLLFGLGTIIGFFGF